MKRMLLSVIAGLSLAAAPAAWAHGGKSGTSGTTGMSDTSTGGQQSMSSVSGSKDDSLKHLSEIDVHLRDALNTTKVLYKDTQLTPSRADVNIQREDLNSIQHNVSAAINHVSHVQNMAQVNIDPNSLNHLQRDLSTSRQIVSQLQDAVNSQDRMQVSQLSSQLFSQLKDADDTFGTIADKQELTRVDNIQVPERQPVRGIKPSDQKQQQLPQDQQLQQQQLPQQQQQQLPQQQQQGTSPSTTTPGGGSNY